VKAEDPLSIQPCLPPELYSFAIGAALSTEDELHPILTLV